MNIWKDMKKRFFPSKAEDGMYHYVFLKLVNFTVKNDKMVLDPRNKIRIIFYEDGFNKLEDVFDKQGAVTWSWLKADEESIKKWQEDGYIVKMITAADTLDIQAYRTMQELIDKHFVDVI